MQELNKTPEAYFTRYAKIQNVGSEQADQVTQKIQSQIAQFNEKFQKSLQFSDIEWVCTEKIHGSNFCFMITPDLNVTCGRRNGELKPEDSFLNFQSVLNEKSENLKQLFKYFEQKYGENKISQITCYGELYGGIYPHENVPKIKSAQIAQRVVYYCPQNAFQVFDITVYLKEEPKDYYFENFIFENNDEDKEDQEKQQRGSKKAREKALKLDQYLKDQNEKLSELFQIKQTYQNMEIACKFAGLDFIQPLQKGKLEDLQQFNVENFKSTIYQNYNLPQLDDYDNNAEGVVIRPYSFSQAPIFKKKAKKFCEETSKARVKLTNEEQKALREEQKKQNQAKFEREREQHEEKLSKLNNMICENRLLNVLSKMTDKEVEDKKLVAKHLLEDALNDFQLESQEQKDWANQDSVMVQNMIQKQGTQSAKDVVQLYFNKEQ